MFGWFKKLFYLDKRIEKAVTESLKEEQEVAQPVVEESVVEKPKKAPAKKKAAPKKKATKKANKAKLEEMTKVELTLYAKNELGLTISRNKTKAYIIDTISKHLK